MFNLIFYHFIATRAIPSRNRIRGVYQCIEHDHVWWVKMQEISIHCIPILHIVYCIRIYSMSRDHTTFVRWTTSKRWLHSYPIDGWHRTPFFLLSLLHVHDPDTNACTLTSMWVYVCTRRVNVSVCNVSDGWGGSDSYVSVQATNLGSSDLISWCLSGVRRLRFITFLPMVCIVRNIHCIDRDRRGKPKYIHNGITFCFLNC